MAVQNDFLPFAVGAGANVLSQSAYAALSAIANGYSSGVAQSSALNKTWRQSSIMAAVISSFIVAQTGQAAVDDGTTATLLANFTQAVVLASKQRVILQDTGAANAYAAANTVPLTALPIATGTVQTVQIVHANTGASTYAPDGLTAKPIYGLGGAALQGGELPANGVATLVSYVGPLLNGGNLCWVLYECIGGAQQIPAATQPLHAMQLGQATGRLLRITTITNTSTFTAGAGTTAVKVRLQGSGAGGGGVAGTGASQIAVGSGGGAGAYSEGYFTSGFNGVTVTIGSAGNGGAATAGGNGGASSFGALMTAPGGTGGSVAGPATAPFQPIATASTVAGTGGYLNSGGNGCVPTSSASNSSFLGTPGAPSVMGSGGSLPATGTNGVAGTNGGGGSGTQQGPSGGSLTGGAGGKGFCIIEEYGSV